MRLIAILVPVVALSSSSCGDKEPARYRKSVETTQYLDSDVPIFGSPIRYQFDLSTRNLEKASGTATLVCTRCLVGDGGTIGDDILPMGGLTLPQLSAGDMMFRARVEDGTATVEGGGKGDDMQLEVSGTITLHEPLSTSELDVHVELRFDADAPNHLANIAKLKGSGDDVIRFRATGTLAKPTLRAQESKTHP